MRLNRLDLNLMVCLDALLAEHSVSRAAERVFLSQPAMSVALRRLREYFADEIVVRTGRSLVLTSFAETLKGPVRDAILQMRAISEWKPSFDPARSERKITIEASDYVTTVYMMKVFERAYLRGPGVRFDLRIVGPDYLDDLDSGAVDLLIIPEAIAAPAHPREPLFTDTFSCVVWKDNALARRRISLDQYLQMGHVITEWNGGRLEALDETLLAQSGYSRRREMTAPSFSLTPQLVIGTQRIATVQTRLAHEMAAHWPIRVLPCPVEIPPIVETVQWHKYQERDPAILWFLHVLRSVAVELRSTPAQAKSASRREGRPRASKPKRKR